MKRRIVTTMDFGPDERHGSHSFKIDDFCYEMASLRALNLGYKQFIYLDVNAPSIPPLPLEQKETLALGEKLKGAIGNMGITGVEVPNEMHLPFKIELDPTNKNFCYSTISVVNFLFEFLGFGAQTVHRMVNYFGIIQETQVKWKGQWMSYSQYPHLKHPILLQKPEIT